jgi:hypothetical protein
VHGVRQEREETRYSRGTARARPMRMLKAAPPSPTRTTNTTKIRLCYGACAALSFTLCAKFVLGSSFPREWIGIILAAFGGWLAADLLGAVYHWNMDNYPSGPNGFRDHHRNPAALAHRSLWTNVRPVALPIAALLAAAVLLTEGWLLQGVPFLPILIPPTAHDRHHARPVGEAAYGGLNGWSNHLTDTTRFFRALEAARERATGRVPLWRSDG